jgi:23S rRNA (uracil1939-C5)-methyltransferase
MVAMKQDKLTKRFKIENLDPMGQGVSKIGDKITFISKTLPGEEGSCEVYQAKKGVEFASMSSISLKSKIRTEPVCPHFDQCPSCHYLHIEYSDELLFKKSSIQNELRKIPLEDEIEIISAKYRFSYRNRIQLHYDLDEEKMGYQDVKNNQIIEVPNCLLPIPSIQEKIKELYQNKFQDFPHNKIKGHIEIFLNAETGSVETAFNKAYAHTGFTQVNQGMNKKALDLIESLAIPILKEDCCILDLFGGKGNLSQRFPQTQKHLKIFVIDKYHPKYIPNNGLQKFVNLDLFKNGSENILAKKVKDQVELMIIDPPRSGFKNIKNYLDRFTPKYLIYMSCKTSTMARDLVSIQDNYKVKAAYLMDFFAGTFHYESLVIVERKL